MRVTSLCGDERAGADVGVWIHTRVDMPHMRRQHLNFALWDGSTTDQHAAQACMHVRGLAC